MDPIVVYRVKVILPNGEAKFKSIDSTTTLGSFKESVSSVYTFVLTFSSNMKLVQITQKRFASRWMART
jgi:hypothetical protein